MYVRVVNPAAKPDPKAKKVEYPWDDIHFIPAAQLTRGKLNRVFMAAPGTYDVYLAMKERLPEKAPKTQTAKMGVVKQSDHGARLPERRDQHQLAARHRQGEHADRAGQRRRSRASVRSCSARRS